MAAQIRDLIATRHDWAGPQCAKHGPDRDSAVTEGHWAFSPLRATYEKSKKGYSESNLRPGGAKLVLLATPTERYLCDREERLCLTYNSVSRFGNISEIL